MEDGKLWGGQKYALSIEAIAFAVNLPVINT